MIFKLNLISVLGLFINTKFSIVYALRIVQIIKSHSQLHLVLILKAPVFQISDQIITQ